MKSRAKIFLGLAIALWLATGGAIASRLQLVFDYATLPLVPSEYEWIAGPVTGLAALSLLLVLVWPLFRRPKPNKNSRSPVAHTPSLKVVACWAAACLPLGLLVLRVAQMGTLQPGWWELAWFALWTGLAVRLALAEVEFPMADQARLWRCVLSLAVLGCGGWWFLQSVEFYADYQLGFNDFGHFTQRVSNTVNGNGFLRESPVLPPFWDHFNPGLLLLIPLWVLMPGVELIFAIQAGCLAGSAWLVAAIARARGQTPLAACGWGCTWLLFPSIGQMNLAYTYGWHPITLAIPCLLAAYLCVCTNRMPIAVVWALVAASFEEGVFVVISCFAAAQAFQKFLASGKFNAIVGWSLVALVAMIGFVFVYQFSGLAPFQTGRFAKLGNGVFEIIASPILRPSVFWGLLLRPRNFAFLCLFLIPFVAVATRAWLWSLLAVSPPLLVLIIWEHMPAQCVAFQYTSCLIPVLFVGIIEPTEKYQSQHSRAFGMLAAAWILSISIGQMPWSNDSLVDVKAATYGVETKWNRTARGEDSQWITSWIQSIQQHDDAARTANLPEWKRLRILATGRVAAHCVGAGDIETVGQFWQRYHALNALNPNLSSPILRYDILLLDFRESFQQTPEETERVYQEAIQHGWLLRERKYEFAVLVR